MTSQDTLALFQSGRFADLVALELRALCDAEGLTAKKLAAMVEIRTGIRLDVRTVQNALAGSCALETFGVFWRAFKWDFSARIGTNLIGLDEVSDRERDLQHERAEIAAREARLDRLRAARRAGMAAPRGELRLVGEEDRTWAAPMGQLGGRTSESEAGPDLNGPPRRDP